MNRFQVRRATVEDLPQLRPLWEADNLPVEALEKRFTEFQIIEDEHGQIFGAIGIEIVENQGRLHSEAMNWAEMADELRAQLWPRLESVALNQGLSCLWTDLTAPFWRGVGFRKAGEDIVESQPAAFASEKAAWLVRTMRAPQGAAFDLDKQIAVLRSFSQAENERLMDRARVMKWIAMGLMTAVFAAFAIWVVTFARVLAARKKRRQREL